MKKTQKITRVQLKINEEDDFHLLGIVSAEPDYKLSLIINNKFRISLKNISPIRIANDSGSELSFSRFTETDVLKEVVFTLVSNRSGNNFLLKKLKNVDYIFQIHKTENDNNLSQVAATLREIESVSAVFSIDVNSLKDKNLHYLS